MDPTQYYQHNHNGSSLIKSIDANSMTSKQKLMEDHLVKSVMHRPLFKIPARKLLKNDDFYEEKDITITLNFVLYFFEMIVSIIIVTLSSVLLNTDDNISVGIYRFFIADSSIALIVSLLFISTLINFEKRNGSFYVTVSLILSFVSFVITISTILPSDSCATSSICSVRKANSAFIIISMFLWLCDLVSFLTILYISRMNLLTDLNFDFADKGLQAEYNASVSSGYNEKDNDLIDPTSGQPLREYYLNEMGEMFEMTNDFDVRGKTKIIVYTI
ncbi:hypothetical protein CANTEDRAFT_113831 [Yamadazyma tenuis ATCC 10573]|nr:uncharacterized protein CANTEDRAFT_113831 [Yamadazyma tenuis ATCC 10573]EGV63790.1 hypothetical protein CANTEDRAFT_113831 [Yamadazyma tenuis ATCC 10573]